MAEAGHVHDLVSLQPAAADRLLTSFYDTGVADASLFTYVPMDFRERLSFPLLAKLLTGAGLLLITGIGAGVVWVLRRWQRRPGPSRQPAGIPHPAAQGASGAAYDINR